MKRTLMQGTRQTTKPVGSDKAPKSKTGRRVRDSSDERVAVEPKRGPRTKPKAKPVSLSNAYAYISEAINEASLHCPAFLFEEDDPFGRAAAGQVQQRLRKALAQRFPLSSGLLEEDPADDRQKTLSRLSSSFTGKNGKWQQTASLLGLPDVYSTKLKRDVVEKCLAFHIASQLHLLGHLLPNRCIQEYFDDKLDGTVIGLLRGHVNAEVQKVYRRLESNIHRRNAFALVVRNTLAEVASALREGRLLLVDNGLMPPKEWDEALRLLESPAFRAEVIAPVYSKQFVDGVTRESAVMYAVAMVIAGIARHLTGSQAHADLYLPKPSGHMVTAVSSRRPGATNVLAPMGALIVLRGWFHGGITLETDSPSSQDLTSAGTVANYEAEGSPSRTYSAPIETGVGRAQAFLSLYGKDSPKISALQGLRLLVLCLCDYLSRQLGGRQHSRANELSWDKKVPWYAYGMPIQTASDLRTRIKEEIDRVPEGADIYESRIAFVVVSAYAIDRSDNVRFNAASALLENWSRDALLARAFPMTAYKLERPGAGVFVVPGITSPAWRHDRDVAMLPGAPVPGNRKGRSYALWADTGKRGGVMGAWSVVWRYDQILWAKSILRTPRLVNLILDQIKMAAECVHELNEMTEKYVCGEYGTALSIARKIYNAHGSTCGFVVNDLIRLAMMVGDYATAIEFSGERKGYAKWDVDGHTNYILAKLIVGDLSGAETELRDCRVCNALLVQFNNEEKVKAYPMMAIAQGLTRAGFSKSGISHHDTLKQVRLALSTLVEHDTEGRALVNRCIESTCAYFNGGVDSPEEMINNTLVTLQQAEHDDQGNLVHAGEIERLLRICYVLQGMVRRARPAHERIDDEPADSEQNRQRPTEIETVDNRSVIGERHQDLPIAPSD